MPPDTEPPPMPDAPLVEPAPWQIPWRQIAAWILAVFVVAWALVLLPSLVQDARLWAGVDMPGENDIEIPAHPEDPELSPKVQDFMLRGKVAERDGRLAEARGLYHQAARAEPRCFSCRLRLAVMERLVREQSIAALEAGSKYLEESRFEDAARHFNEVLALVPDPKASFHVLAQDGLEKARAGAKRSGRPLP